MAAFRDQRFVPEEVGYLGMYYSDLSESYRKKAEEQEQEVASARQSLENLMQEARKARETGSGAFVYDNTRFATSLFLDNQNNPRSTEDMLQNHRFLSRDQNKYISGSVSKYLDSIKEKELEYESASQKYNENRQRYDGYVVDLNKRNEERKAKFLETKQEGLEAGQATAYKGATYIEKPR
jgi:hypothetical protein